jgi:hypothetical protein
MALSSAIQNNIIQKKITDHAAWLKNLKGGVRANFIGSYIADIYVKEENLKNGLFSCCIMNDCQFINVDFTNCSFYQSVFINCEFQNCNFESADFTGSIVKGTSFVYCNMKDSIFYSALVNETSMSKSFNLCDIKYLTINKICPEVGSFIGWKKGFASDIESEKEDDVVSAIIKLEITEDAKRVNSFSRKCRCSKAKVLDIKTYGGSKISEAYSINYPNFIYKVGNIIEASDFNDDPLIECAPGIHFFITEKEAREF